MTKCDYCIEVTSNGKCPVENEHNVKQVYCEDAVQRMTRVQNNQEETGESDYIIQKGMRV